MTNELVDAMVSMKELQAVAVADKMFNRGEDPLKVLEFCRLAVETVGKRFEAGKYFLPELILAGKMLKKISKMAKPYLKDELKIETERLGQVVIGTVQGDIHDIGKDIVAFLLEINGFEVHDLGVDVPASKFVDTIKEVQPQVVGLGALLTVAFESLKSTVEAMQAAGLREQVKIMIGGGGVDEKILKYSGADAYGEDAMAAVNLSKKWTDRRYLQ